MSDGSPPSESRVISFRDGRARPQPPLSGPPPVADLAKYQAPDEADDYRHRMIVNTVAFLFLAALIGGGLWLVDSMAKMRKDQDCVLSGRRGCTPVDLNIDNR